MTDYYLNVLEETFLSYADLKSVSVNDNGETMVSLEGTGISYSISGNIPPSTGHQIYVRDGLIARLKQAQKMIFDLFPGGQLDVVYGYRNLAVQTKKYTDIRQTLQPNYTDEDTLSEAVHRHIAIPDVAGHPTGGAVDVQVLTADGNPIDMGTDVHELTKDSYVFNPFISKTAWLNRQKLRIAMLAAGFAPFDGEWWHFSYGDREWAAYYKKPSAIYNQIEFDG